MLLGGFLTMCEHVDRECCWHVLKTYEETLWDSKRYLITEYYCCWCNGEKSEKIEIDPLPTFSFDDKDHGPYLAKARY